MDHYKILNERLWQIRKLNKLNALMKFDVLTVVTEKITVFWM
jgi:hypothetical protein